MKNNIKSIIVVYLILISCSTSNTFISEQSYSNINQARINVISDFVNIYKTPKRYIKEREGKPFNVFRIFNNDIKGHFYSFRISPNNNNYISLSIKERVGKVPESNFPNRYIIKENKLFLWKDETTPLSKELLNVIHEYGILDSIDVKKELGLLPDNFEDIRLVTMDDNLEGVDYYVCKSNISKYKSVKTKIAYGSYKKPTLKCN